MSGAVLMLAVALAGGLGAAGRFVVDGLLRSRRAEVITSPTLVVNVLGSAVLGALTGAEVTHGLATGAYLVVGVGFCGGFTTFSTAMVEAVRLVQTGRVRRAAAEVIGSMVVCVLAAAIGYGVVALTA